MEKQNRSDDPEIPEPSNVSQNNVYQDKSLYDYLYIYRIYNLTPEQIILFSAYDYVEEIEKDRNLLMIITDISLSKVLDELVLDYDMSDYQEIDWSEEYKKYLKPGSLTDRFRYGFEPATVTSDDTADYIYIYPAMAFGTGSHATTQLAAELIEKAAEGMHVIDIGVGSGILSIIAKKSGAISVTGLDLDQNSIDNSRINFQNNDVGDYTLFLSDGSLQQLGSYQDSRPMMLVANIISSTILELKDQIFELRPDILIFSGMMSNEKEFINIIKPENYRLGKIIEKDGWFAFSLYSVNYLD